MMFMTIWLLSDPPLLFDTVHVKTSTPVKVEGGIYVKPPCALKETRVPMLGTEQLFTIKTPLGPGLSFARIPGAFMVSICPTWVVKLSGTVNPIEGFDGEDGFDGVDTEDGRDGVDVTPMKTWELSDPPLPLVMIHVKLVIPTKLAKGINVKPPWALKVRLPLLGTLQVCTFKTSLGPEISFARIPGALTMNGCADTII